MSITIKHLDGPLKGLKQAFDDSAGTILVGRSAEAQIVYPEECIAVDGEHFRLNRDDGGGYRAELPDSCDVEIDGKPAEDNEPVVSGSVVTVGESGPSFEVLLPGVTINHREGPLAGLRQFFPFGTKTISVGRLPRQNDVTYPADCAIVGRTHFSLKGDADGNYCVELTPNHYVQIGDHPADNGALVPLESTFRLGNSEGPCFSIEIEKPQSAGIVTTLNAPVSTVREKLGETDQRLDYTRKYGTYALAGLATILVGFGVWSVVEDWQRREEVRQLAASLAAADVKVSELAENDIPQWAQEKLRQAVYLVAKLESGRPAGAATAFAFAPDTLATNAHVVKEMIDKNGLVGNDFILIAPDGTEIKLAGARAEIHPAYFAFSDYKNTLGQVSGDKFKPLDIIKQYDVGIIHLAEPLPGEPAVLELASKDYVESLKPGTAVASVGFPMEGMAGTMVVTKAPASLRYGYIGALTDVFMSRADPDKLFLIQHSVPVAGGVSGSPLIDKSGKVIGIVSGGTTSKALREVADTLKPGAPDDDNARDKKSEKETETFRIPSAAMINFAHRIDLLEDMASGEAAGRVAGEQAYWDAAAKSFDRLFDGAIKQLLATAAERYGIGGGAKMEIGEGTLTPRKPGSFGLAVATHDYELKPGHVYAVIADAKSGVRLALNVKKKGTPELLRDAKDPQKTSVPQLAPVVWVTVKEPTKVEIDVLGTTERPADYALYVYDWDGEALAAGASAATE